MATEGKIRPHVDSKCAGPYSVSFLLLLGARNRVLGFYYFAFHTCHVDDDEVVLHNKSWTRIETGSHVLLMTLVSITIGAVQERHCTQADLPQHQIIPHNKSRSPAAPTEREQATGYLGFIIHTNARQQRCRSRNGAKHLHRLLGEVAGQATPRVKATAGRNPQLRREAA